MRQPIALLLLSLLVSTPSSIAFAQWQPDGVALCTASNDQHSPAIVSDGAGGAIVTWYEIRSGTNYDIYAQRVDAAGIPQWTPDGVALCTAANDQYYPTIVLDGAGGAIVTWVDERSPSDPSDIYAQRISASGVPQWTINGVALCTASYAQEMPVIATDGVGGAIVAWQDLRNGALWDVYAQRVDASGITKWGANGIVVCITTWEAQYEPAIVSDGAGGAFITWRDERTDIEPYNWSIYAQRVNAAGVSQWTACGVHVCDSYGAQGPSIIQDSAGGAIVMWNDGRDGTLNVFVQRLDGSGVPQWTADGVALCTAVGHQDYPTIVSDDAGGAIVTWHDYRSGNSDIYAQRVNAAGATLWSVDGAAVSTAPNAQVVPIVVSDSFGGAVVTWTDYRSGINYDIYAQRVNAAGIPQWTADGVAVCTAVNNQNESAAISDNAGGAIVTWADFRGGLASDIYAQHVVDLPDSVAVLTIDPGARKRFSFSLYNNTSTAGYAFYRVQGDAPLTFEMEDQLNGFVPSLFGVRSVDPHSSLMLFAWVQVAEDAVPEDSLRFHIVSGLAGGTADPDTSVVIVHVGSNPVGVRGGPPPLRAALNGSMPNPFSSSTRLRYVVPDGAGEVSLSIYDAAGRHIRTLLRRALAAGEHTAEWNGTDGQNARVPSGVYFCALRGRDFSATTKLLLLR